MGREESQDWAETERDPDAAAIFVRATAASARRLGVLERVKRVVGAAARPERSSLNPEVCDRQIDGMGFHAMRNLWAAAVFNQRIPRATIG